MFSKENMELQYQDLYIIVSQIYSDILGLHSNYCNIFTFQSSFINTFDEWKALKLDYAMVSIVGYRLYNVRS